MSFKDTPHQESTGSFLKSAIRQNRLPHALLFSGPPGSGQTETALALAKALFCREQKKGEPCDICVDCRQTEKRQHPDLLWLGPEEDSRVIKIEEIRTLIARSNLKPFQALRKVFVIDRAGCLNDAAQNALLKTLEEPEGSAYFVLISYATEKLLSTVRSRTQLLNFVPVAGEGVSKAALTDARFAVFSYASMARPQGSTPPDLSALSREETLEVLEAAIGDLREALLIEVGAGAVLGAIDQRPRKESAAQELGRDVLIERLEILAEFKDKIAHSVNTKLALAVLWEKL